MTLRQLVREVSWKTPADGFRLGFVLGLVVLHLTVVAGILIEVYIFGK